MPKQHAPGYVDKRFEVHEGQDYVVILGPHDTTDAPAARVFGDTTEETLYFANLFAAAPDLLDILSSFMKNHKLILMTRLGYSAEEVDQMLVHQDARAAIAKATGAAP